MNKAKVDEILRTYDKLDNESRETLLYRLDKEYKIIENIFNKNFPNTNKKYRFVGKNYFANTILDRDFYAKDEDDVLNQVKAKLNFLFRTKKELLKVSHGDGHIDEPFESDVEAEVYIHRKYSNCITDYQISEK